MYRVLFLYPNFIMTIRSHNKDYLFQLVALLIIERKVFRTPCMLIRLKSSSFDLGFKV